MATKGALRCLLLLAALTTSNVLAVCPAGCRCNDESLHVDCVEANLDIVPITLNPSITKLNLRNNKIRSVDTGFNFYHQLTYVDLSHNQLIKVLPGSFKEQSKLLELNLNTNKISSLANDTFGPGLKSLSVLSFRQNLLESLEPRLFFYVKSLEELDLGQNTIKWLNGSSFEGLTNLRTLQLDNNELSAVPEFLSKTYVGQNGNHVPHLAKLHLNYNGIERIGNDDFFGGQNLLTLDLRGNKISVIEEYGFRGLEKLRTLILSDNNLRAIPTSAFGALARLETLKIGRNPIVQIGANAFQGVRLLKWFEFDGAPELVVIDKDAFGANLDLEKADISKGGKLTELPSRLFSQQPVKDLELRENALTTLPEDLVNWRNLHSLRLENNKFLCNCDLLWLRDTLQDARFANTSSDVLCFEPEEYRKSRLTSVSSKDLQCYLNGPVEKTVLGIVIGVAVIILVLIFFVAYKYHDRIKNFCKRGFRRPARKNRSSVISSTGKPRVDPASKASFLGPSSQYMYSDEEFAIRASLMSAASPAQSSFLHSHTLNHHHNGGGHLGGGGHHFHHPQHHNTSTPSHNNHHHNHHNTFSSSIRYPSQHHHHGNAYHLDGYDGPPMYSSATANEYATPHVNLNLGFPKYPTLHNGDSNGLHHLHYPGGPPVKPIPITEL